MIEMLRDETPSLMINSQSLVASEVFLDDEFYRKGCNADINIHKLTKSPVQLESWDPLDPIPIAMDHMEVVDEVPLFASSLANHDENLIESVIHTLKQKKRKMHSGSQDSGLICETIIFENSLQKRRRTEDLAMITLSNPLDDKLSFTEPTSNPVCFKSHQTTLWKQRFLDLCLFQRTEGHCLVPHNYKENLPLAKWVKRQRYQYKLKMEGRHSTLTDDRLKALNELGFIWDSHRAIWEERINELRTFKAIHGHCNVPSTYRENHSLSVWVQCQRRQYKLYRNGMKAANMNNYRISRLDELGFVWDPRNHCPKN